MWSFMRERNCSSYVACSLMALAKMVGFDVMPRTPRSSSSASWPSWIQSRRRLSSHGLWPPIV